MSRAWRPRRAACTYPRRPLAAREARRSIDYNTPQRTSFGGRGPNKYPPKRRRSFAARRSAGLQYSYMELQVSRATTTASVDPERTHERRLECGSRLDLVWDVGRSRLPAHQLGTDRTECHFQRPPHRQGGLPTSPMISSFSEAEYLMWCPPHPPSCFFGAQFSSVRSATTSFRALASRRR